MTEQIKTDYTREELIALCERAITPQDRWDNRDSAGAQRQIGDAWALLRAGCKFYVHPAREGGRGCFTDNNTIWVTCEFKGFNAFEYGDDASAEDELSYIPTAARLDAADGKDWY